MRQGLQERIRKEQVLIPFIRIARASLYSCLRPVLSLKVRLRSIIKMRGFRRYASTLKARNGASAEMEKADLSDQEAHVEVRNTLWHLLERKKESNTGLYANHNPKGVNTELDGHELKKIARKIDYRLLPMLTVLYILSFIDRSNIGNAKVAGMNEELKLTGHQYNMALTVFFFPYCLFEVPSNIVLKLTKPSRWIAVLVISWGLVWLLSTFYPFRNRGIKQLTQVWHSRS